MKVKFSMLLLIIAVFVSSAISGCSHEKATEAFSSSSFADNQSDVSRYYGNLSVSQKIVSADKIYGVSDNTLYSRV